MAARKTYILKLYVAGNTPNSMRALNTLREILENEFKGVYALKVIDVLKQPQLADLRESGSIEQDADVVMFVYREAYYLERKQPKLGSIEHAEWQSKMNDVNGLADIILGKQRHGPTGTVKVEFEGIYTKFKDLNRN